MKVTLISSDSELPRLCREVLSESVDKKWELCAIGPDETPTHSDIFVWDIQAGMTVPENLEQIQNHFFLVEYRHLADFRKSTGDLPVNIVLKPATRATLRAFLHQGADRELPIEQSADALKEERDEVLQCLLQSNLRLQVYDQERTNFLARAVHDFRAPLTALRGYSGLLLARELGPITSEQEDVLKRMEHCSKRLFRMASAMFQLSIGGRLQSKPALQKNDIIECVNQALYEVRMLIDEKCLTISTNLKSPPEWLYFERSGIEQVLINLLDNAVKFTPKFGQIEINGYPYFWERRTSVRTPELVRAERRMSRKVDPNTYRIDVRDSGVGILREQLNTIFEEFTSYSGGSDRSGGGLGLAICRMIMQQHDGKVWAENVEGGAMLSFVIPYRRSEARTTPDEPINKKPFQNWKSEVRVDTGG